MADNSLNRTFFHCKYVSKGSNYFPGKNQICLCFILNAQNHNKNCIGSIGLVKRLEWP